MEFNFFSLLVITFLAFFVPMVLERRRIPLPLVVAEILVGIAVGKSGLNIIGEDVWIEFLSTLGFAYLMFTSGLEIDFSSNKAAQFMTMGTVVFVSTLLVSYGLALMMAGIGLIKDPLVLVLILATTSLGVVTPILKEKGLFNHPLGQSILSTALIADFVTIFLITIYFAVVGSNDGKEWFWVVFLFLAFFVMLRFFGRLARSQLMNRVRNGIAQIEVRGSLFLIIFFVALSEVLGSEIILGAFLAGVMVSILLEEDADIVYDKLDAIGYGFLIPIFFIMVGVRFDFREIFTYQALLLVPLLLILMYVVKVVPALIYTRMFGLKTAVASGVLLSARLSLIIATSSVAVEAGLISRTTGSAIILVAILTCVISPWVFNRLVPSVENPRDKVVIIGVNEYTMSLHGRLTDLFKVKYYDPDPQRWTQGQQLGLSLVTAEGLEKELQVATVVLAGAKDENLNLHYGLMARQSGVERVGCLISGETAVRKAQSNGVEVISPELAVTTTLDAFIRVPHTLDLADEELTEIVVRSKRHVGLLVREMDILGDGLLLRIFRGGDSFIPHGNTRLHAGDILLYSGSRKNAIRLRSILS